MPFHLVTLALLTACAHTPSTPAIAPPHPPPSLCAAIPDEPKLPDNAGIVQPVTDQERDAVSAFLSWAFLEHSQVKELAARIIRAQKDAGC